MDRIKDWYDLSPSDWVGILRLMFSCTIALFVFFVIISMFLQFMGFEVEFTSAC